MSAHEAGNSSESLSLTEVAARFDISPQTLRRLCDGQQLPCERDARGWRVDPREVDRYLVARRPAGRQRVALWLQGPAPNPNLRDAIGWRFMAAGKGGTHIPVEIWFTNELVAMLRHDDHDVRDLVVRASERLVADTMLVTDLGAGGELVYGSADRAFVLRVAGAGDESYVVSEAPMAEGVSVLYDFAARDGIWPGDRLEVADSECVDVVVAVRAEGASRRVRAIRLRNDATPPARRDAVRYAIEAYEARCRELGIRAGPWLAEVASHFGSLTQFQHRVLDLVYECWRTEGDWPVFSYVDKRMDSEYDLELSEVLTNFPPGLMWGLPRYGGRPDKLTLTAAGLAQCEGASTDVELFLATVGYLVQRHRDFMPSSPTKEENLSVGSDDIRRDVPLAGSAATGVVERLYDLLIQDPFLTHGGGKNETGAWNINVGPEIRRYRGVETIDDYLTRREPGFAPWGGPIAPTLTTLTAEITDLQVNAAGGSPAAPSAADGSGSVFVLMPFRPQFNGVWKAILGTCDQVGVTCSRSDTITLPGRITGQIMEAIRSANVIVADVTDNNPNVMFELGYADALGKPIVVLNQRLEEAPFDLRDWRQISYAPTELDNLVSVLGLFLREVLIKLRVTIEPTSRDVTPSPEGRVRDEIHRLALGVYNTVPFTVGEWAETGAFEETIFRACIERGGMQFEYQPTLFDPSDQSRGWQLPLTPLGAYTLRCDSKRETLERVAREHDRIVRVVKDSKACVDLRHGS
ncbi:MAG: helix-turn-helix domain-containing protein [Candidatus Dormiibacterota bacterium]